MLMQNSFRAACRNGAVQSDIISWLIPANKRKIEVIIVGTGLAGHRLPHRSANWVTK